MIIDESNAHEYVKNQVMYISNRNVTELKFVPPNVTVLDCNDNKLTTLPDLPNVHKLVCGHNQLTTLPDLPNVKSLYCGSNKLTKLPELPNVSRLFCSRNRLTTLPELPNVEVLDCGNNKLITLPELPNITELYCRGNNFNLFELFSNKNRTLNELELIVNSIESKPFTTAVNMLKQGKRFSQVRLWLQDALIDSGEWKDDRK